jgi:hypothetical protein
MLESLPWPNVVGKRCLAVGRCADAIKTALEARRADHVVVDPGDGIDGLAGDPFDLVVAWGLVTDAPAPLDRLRTTWRATRNMCISIEPIDALLTVATRPLPLLRLAPTTDGRSWTMNGRAHHRLMTTAGFVVERPSQIVAVRDEAPPTGRVERALGRLLTRGRAGTPYRALVARARP